MKNHLKTLLLYLVLIAVIIGVVATIFQSTEEEKIVPIEEVVFEDGCILIGDKPGLGIDVNIDAVEERPYHPINLRHYTGNLTEIRPKDDTIFYFKGIGENK